MFAEIFNDCLQNGICLNCLKNANIAPVHKKDSKLLAGNYRPISLLSNVGQIFEKLIPKRLYYFLDRNNVIYDYQIGFRKGHSTNHAIISLMETIRDSLDNNSFAVGIFVDLQKAFDTVEH